MLILSGRFKRALPFLLLSVSLVAFNPVFAETNSEKNDESHHGHEQRDWPGVYHGFLPCADCVGIKTTLALNKNNSYVLITQYAGKSPRDFVEKGKYAWDEKTSTIVLTPRKYKDATIRRYAVAEDMLIQLDDNGNRYTGKLADKYILRRNDVTAEPPEQHSGH